VEWSRDWWRFCIDPEFPEERAREMARDGSIFRYSLQRSQIVPFTANGIIDRFVPRGR